MEANGSAGNKSGAELVLPQLRGLDSTSVQRSSPDLCPGLPQGLAAGAGVGTAVSIFPYQTPLRGWG